MRDEIDPFSLREYGRTPDRTAPPKIIAAANRIPSQAASSPRLVIVHIVAIHKLLENKERERRKSTVDMSTDFRRYCLFFCSLLSLWNGVEAFTKSYRNQVKNVQPATPTLNFPLRRSTRSVLTQNMRKRKDNRKYVVSSKENDDEPDEDYFEELAEDVKALLRSSTTSPKTSRTSPDVLKLSGTTVQDVASTSHDADEKKSS